MNDERILGIDGGGTKVLQVLADRQGGVLRSAQGGGINPMDNPNWLSELNKQLSAFLNEPGLASIGAALPAYGESERISERQHQAITDAFGRTTHILLNDVDAAHLGAFAGGAGILVLSGTGSMAWRRDGNGISSRTGGWGDVIGDEGSSHWIGKQALNKVSQSLDGRAPATSLAGAVFSHLGLDINDPLNALTTWVSNLSLPRAEIAALSVLVDQEAKAGDGVANSLIEQAADELVKHFRAILPPDETDMAWSYAGGTFASRIFLNAVTVRIGYPPVLPRLPPVGGALLAAAQKLDWPITSAFVDQIAAATCAAGQFQK